MTGAIAPELLEKLLSDAGFTDIEIEVQEESREFIKEWLPGMNAAAYVRSARIQARKK
ncbi:MAG: hypothetical protein RBR60_14380 [Desulfobotulus sp.]|nr:hypothetical protein [Desulfobotulus sp.]MDY0164415.1 hypothetical protein [Desulfobotulus sp.]